MKLGRTLLLLLVAAFVLGQMVDAAPHKPPGPAKSPGPEGPPMSPQEAQAYGDFVQGVQLYKLGRWEEAVKPLLRTLKANPKNQQAWYILGMAYVQLMRWDDAAAAFLQASSINFRDHNTWVQLGNVEMSRGNYDKAREYVRRIFTFDTRSFYAYYALGVIDYKEGKIGPAISNFDHARALYEDFAPAHYNLANCHYNQHNISSAMGRIRKAVTLDPKKPLYLFLQGWYGFMTNDPGTGFLSFRHLLEEDKKNGSYSDTARAFLAMRTNNLVDAKKSLDEAIKKDPENIKALVLKALILVKENNKDEAVKSLQEALALDSLDYDARDVLTHLGVTPPPPHPARLPGQTPTPSANPSPGPSGKPSAAPSARPSASPTATPPPPPGVPR